MAKAVYGVENEIDFIAKAQEDGIFPKDLVLDDEAVTKKEAAYLLDSVMGNEEDFKIITVFAAAEYAMLSANTYMADGTYPEAFKPYIIKEIAGMKIAIAGLTDDESKLYTHYTNTKEIDFKNQFETAKEVIAKADAESDIVLAHLHSDNKIMCYQQW